MEYQSYEDYMRQVLGYSSNNPNIYEPYNYKNQQPYEDTYYRNNMSSIKFSEEEINELYPDIYRLVYPMVCKICDTNTQLITKELVEKMTDEVYFAIEDTKTAENIRTETKREETTFNSFNIRKVGIKDERLPRYIDEKKLTRTETLSKPSNEKREVNRNVSESRQIRQNSTLRDLIKILILQQLLGGNIPNRQRPHRPPFSGGPGMPPPPNQRPPFPREI